MNTQPNITLAHPNDPSVMQTGLTEVFLDNALSQTYPARILTRTSAKKLTLRPKFETAWQSMLSDQEFIIANIDANGQAILEFMPNAFEPIQAELKQMAEAYAHLSGEDYIEITIGKSPIGKKPHPHNFPVLNCSWFCQGTNWIGPEGLNIVEEGNLFYFPKNFWHASTIANENEKRFTMVLTPAGEI